MPVSSLRPSSPVWQLARRFSPHLFRVRYQALLSAALTIVGPLLAALLLWLGKLPIDEVFVGGRIDLLPTFIAAYAVLLAGKFTLGYVETRLEAWIVEQIVLDSRADLYRHFVTVSPGSLRKHGIGDLLTHLSGDVERVE